MKNKDRYPDNWDEIALMVKIKANWTCSKCKLECIPNGADFRTEIMGRSLRAQLTLTVQQARL